MSRIPSKNLKPVSPADDDARSESSYTSLMTESPSATAASIGTISELYPYDSVSHRHGLTMAAQAKGAASSGGTPSLFSGAPTSESGNLYQVIDGRVFSSQSDVYALPADEEEHSRLDIQHFAYCLWMDSLYPFKTLVRHVLREGQTPPPEILDAGTGSGRWAGDMAASFPHANVVGMDIVPPASLDTNTVPSNCHFEIDDMNLSMDHHQGIFSVVHARMAEAGLNDPESFCYEMARVLKPGGVFILGRADIQFYDETMLPLPWVEPGQPGWMDSNPNFTDVLEENAWIPLGPWKEGLNERETLAANLMREDMSRIFKALRQLLSSEGHSEDDIQHWTDEANRELREMSPKIYHRGAFVGAVRNNGAWQERPMRVAPEDLLARSMILGAGITKPRAGGDSDIVAGNASTLE